MKYIIMAGGPATRWRNYQNTTKHLIKIGNENLLERIVRQLQENGCEEIFIISDNPLYEVPGSTRLPLIYDYKLYNMFYKKYLNEECVYLYGDTWYNDDIIRTIVNQKTENIDFFGTTESIVGIKVVNHNSFKYYVDDMVKNDIDRAGWALYRRINKINRRNRKVFNTRNNSRVKNEFLYIRKINKRGRKYNRKHISGRYVRNNRRKKI